MQILCKFYANFVNFSEESPKKIIYIYIYNSSSKKEKKKKYEGWVGVGGGWQSGR